MKIEILGTGCYICGKLEALIDVWNVPVRVIHIDTDHRPDLAQQYAVFRAPTLVLVNAEGQAVWKQDEGLSDESPLDLNQAERQIEALTTNQ